MKTVTIFGGSGFVGRHLVQQLAKANYHIRVAVRRPSRAGFLQPLGGVSQIETIAVDILDEESVHEAVKGAEAVVNLVGIIAPSGRQKFNEIHIQGARSIAIAAKEADVRQLVHMSALGAGEKSNSKYARTKAHGEDAVLNMDPSAIIFRPSVIFGPEDEFFNRFANLMQLTPIMPVFAKNTKFQPVFVGDVASAISAAIMGKGTPGTIYELGGPEIISMLDVHKRIREFTGLRSLLLPLPLILAKILALITSPLPNAPITRDQIKLLKKDNVVSMQASSENRTLTDISPIRPHSIDTIVPLYLDRFINHKKQSVSTS